MYNSEELGYQPENLKRELKKFYISSNLKDINEMLAFLEMKNLDELFNHIDEDVKFNNQSQEDKEIPLEYNELIENLKNISKKNKIPLNFLGDGLNQYKRNEIISYISNIRGLTTAYTPYQPERSQGTLYSLWMYSNALSSLTGMEAINASLYDRSTCLFEALKTAQRIAKKKNTILISETIFPSDKNVLETLKKNTSLIIKYIPINKMTGQVDSEKIFSLVDEDTCAIAFPQINGLGIIEDCNRITDIAKELKLQTIAIIDPILLASNGLTPPSEYGEDKTGVDMIVAEGQHMAIDPNFGGPGLGIFGIRFNQKNKNLIRSTPGRYIGKTIDSKGKDCLSIVLSTREQHIRREKATSNICSNQSFVATIAGAFLLSKGDIGLSESIQYGRRYALKFLAGISPLQDVQLLFNTPFFNELVLKINGDLSPLIINQKNIVAGKDISHRYQLGKGLLKLSFTDIHTEEDIENLILLFKNNFKLKKSNITNDISKLEIPHHMLRASKVNLPQFSISELEKFYNELGGLNLSPDDDIYPLGSCTMKYNPYINDWAANLESFRKSHPDLPEIYTQGSLEILYEIQERFKKITGLPAVTTQPVAGAQGELVGLKMFQAYHQDKNNHDKNIILIPASAHGTNPATATMAGYETKIENGNKIGVRILQSNKNGKIDLEYFKNIISSEGKYIAGIMITNPNTLGIFEDDFKVISDLIHSVDALVYMDGANMNAIAGIVDLNKLGVDAVHNNLHKTWTIPHGGGGPGDAIVAVSEKLIPYLPGKQIGQNEEKFYTYKSDKSVGEFHRHYGNFAHKVRAYTYLKALGDEGIKAMSSVAVLNARYLLKKLSATTPIIPSLSQNIERLHEFIITISEDTFKKLEEKNIPRSLVISKLGKLFLDFGLHSPTVSFPEIFGLMIEPTESFSKNELDRFYEVIIAIYQLTLKYPEVLMTAPHFTPIRKVNEVYANKNLKLSEEISSLPKLPKDLIQASELRKKDIKSIIDLIIEKHENE